MSETNLTAEPVATLDWIRKTPSIAVPVYQRVYRWNLDSCHQLLEDVRAVGRSDEPAASHFLGAILATGTDHVTLVDGQQRLTTVVLLLLAVRDAALTDPSRPVDARDAADQIDAIVFSDLEARELRLLTNPAHAATLAALAARDVDIPSDGPADALRANYDEFAREVAESWREVWRGLSRLEHVVITLGRGANAQQVFESLNSTGEPLANHELMHNYVLMGLEHRQQREIEDAVWAPIDDATGDETERFWRDYLVLTSERTPDLTGEHGLYRAFKERFPDLGYDRVTELGADWLEHADCYAVLRSPEKADDPAVATQLRFLRDHFPGMSALTLGLYRDHTRGGLTAAELVELCELVQSMSLRRAIVGLDRDLGLAARLCRILADDNTVLTDELVKRTPEDLAVKLALRHQTVPLATYVLQRLQDVESADGLQVEHIYPQNPDGGWSGDGIRRWSEMSEDEQADLRIALGTIGNLTLLEAPLNQGAGNRPFAAKKAYYRASTRVPWVRDRLATFDAWDKLTIQSRTAELTERLLQTWRRPSGIAPSEPVELLAVVDLPRVARRGLFQGQFEYAVYGKRLLGDVTGVKELWLVVVKELWRTRRDDLLAYATTNHQIIRDHRPPRERWEPLAGGYFVFWGWAYQWLLDELQKLVLEFGLGDRIRVKLADPEQL